MNNQPSNEDDELDAFIDGIAVLYPYTRVRSTANNIKEVLEKLVSHDDGVEYGNGYHDECKEEVYQALAEIKRIVEEEVIQSYKHCDNAPCAKTNCNFAEWMKEDQLTNLLKALGGGSD